ncbi:hypothetical protein BGI40_01630 [Snodgrassella communis]|uniref:Uncharacterized protein n=1 Tax=Snodgrassella communis TaxID=2946699 RepID=A0A836MPE8_9NEIS|nr:hypothetical protein [Snodgrassella communis]KDN14025.1 hypothetical protein SALWKB29_1927 [Snodgrassella communis]PIT10700.1 hypothetical protein BGI29_01670 [Snodgrassella communis]PIT30368.1 hypothetical protein BGI39_00750 [Snodgrassella communis]PIT30494.1 hypothetical protein BGI38_00805 [Snodgrassella communis]PIT37111.1 hypothetical protein BGI40_01630 [Snodgrassella communis]
MNNVTYKPVKEGVHVVVLRTALKKEKSNRANNSDRGKCKLVKTVIAEETFDEWEAAYAWGNQFLV